MKTLTTSTFGKVRAATVSADGQTLAVSLGDTTVRLLDAQTGAWKRTLSSFNPPPLGLGSVNVGHPSDGLTLKFSPNGHFLLAGTSQVWRGVPKARPDPSVLHLYSATSGRLLLSWAGAPASRMAFSPYSQHLISAAQGLYAFLLGGVGGEQGVRFLPIQFGSPEINLGGSLPTFVYGRPAVLGTLRQADGVYATLWVGGRTLVQDGELRGSSTFSASPGLHWIAAQGDSGLTLWRRDTAEIQVQRPADTSFAEGDAALNFSPDDRLLAGQVCPGAVRGCGLHMHLQLWAVATGTVLASRESDDVPFAVQDDGSVWTLTDGTLEVWQARIVSAYEVRDHRRVLVWQAESQEVAPPAFWTQGTTSGHPGTDALTRLTGPLLHVSGQRAPFSGRLVYRSYRSSSTLPGTAEIIRGWVTPAGVIQPFGPASIDEFGSPLTLPNEKQRH